MIFLFIFWFATVASDSLSKFVPEIFGNDIFYQEDIKYITEDTSSFNIIEQNTIDGERQQVIFRYSFSNLHA
jgi:hypothetical protein